MTKMGNLLALAWLLGLLIFTATAPLYLSQSAEHMDFSKVLEAPSFQHLFGTDALGRDLLSRVLLGARVSLSVGVMAVGLALAVGVLLGALAGYYGGWCDRLLMALVDIMLCFPAFFLILAVIAVLGPNILNIMVIIGLTGWMGTARLVRAEILSLKEREFILASRALGAPGRWIIWRHLVPNSMGPVIVNAILGVSSAILIETGLSFLGIGVQPPTPSWGNILLDGKAALGVAWWLTFFPGIMIFLTVLSANVLGETLRDIHRR
jgi:peptide/nickel transport system permease protein